jgi:hypothetical protein
MAWSIEKIERDLLGGRIDIIALPPATILETVKRAETVLGSEWIASFTSAKGLLPAMDVIGTGLCLTSLEGLADSDKLIERIRRKESSADAELTAIYLLRSGYPLPELELYPPVGTRRADFRLRRGTEQWTTVEVTQALASNEQNRVQVILHRLTDSLLNIDAQIVLEVQFRREPTDDEISLLCDRLPNFCCLRGQQRAELADGMGFIFLDEVEIGRLRYHEIPELADTPMIGLAMFQSGGPGGTPHHQIAVRIPFSDTRADEFLHDEAKQLPKQGPGLIMICGPTSRNELRVWSALIQRRFEHRIHTRVSGVCLFAGGMVPVANGYGWLVRAELVLNPHARVALPDWIRTVLVSGSGLSRKLSLDRYGAPKPIRALE